MVQEKPIALPHRASVQATGLVRALKLAGRSVVVAAMLSGGLAQPAPVSAKAPALALGQVSLTPLAPKHYRQLFADTLSTELSAENRRYRKPHGSFVINARLATLETQRSRPAKSRCTVSLVLTDRSSGSIYAMAEGKVVVEESAPDRAEVLAIKAAVKSALKSVASAIDN